MDPLVLPVAVAPEAPVHVLEAARQLRAEYGDAIHLTGGLSNVSFGMPARKLLNDTFIDLAAEAGIDSGIIDPVASDLGARVRRGPRPARRTGWRRTCCSGATRSAASTSRPSARGAWAGSSRPSAASSGPRGERRRPAVASPMLSAGGVRATAPSGPAARAGSTCQATGAA